MKTKIKMKRVQKSLHYTDKFNQIKWKALFPVSLISLVFLFCSCEEKAEITIVNKIHNVRLEQISYQNIAIGGSLVPGESICKTISDEYSGVKFPMKSQIKFYMTKGDNLVLLKTKEYYTLDKDDELYIELTDETEVISLYSE